MPQQQSATLLIRPAVMGGLLGSVYRVIATHLIKKAGLTKKTARIGAVTLIQRFRWVKAPTSAELTYLAHTIGHRVGRYLEQQGLLERDAENSYLTGDVDIGKAVLRYYINATIGFEGLSRVFEKR